MTRGGRPDDKDGPERRCIVTGDVQPKSGLIRFVVAPEGLVVPDLAQKLPGRGIWVSAERKVLETAVKKGLFARAAKNRVTVPDGLADMIERQLTARLIDLVSLARKAGQAVAGYEKVKEWLASERAVVLLQASDGSERGKTKLRPPDGKDSHIELLNASELGLAFGREHVIHGALAAGGLATRVVEDAARLRGLRKRIGGGAAGKDTKNS